ncbi:MAG: DUF418 domain-containing protein [Bacteroides sp.]|nr:DUF418 domain-containing protein [Bacteroides sp.]MCM1413417.1 DUF418 domain-containing protein [Bacteroides sp.]MCM1471372.1 DUF418 domain-containing protein [Bacteroides sp.]
MIENKEKSYRLEVVDALRGFALLAIVLLHNLEHYNIFYSEDLILPGWVEMAGNRLSEFIYFLFAGKAYATFSLLFGFSFYIQMRNARRRGSDFRLRFAWRMLLLFGFAQLHALFYNGDILLLYAFCGMMLIPASSWSNKTVLIVACLLMLQPWCWAKIMYAMINPDYIDTNSEFIKYAVSAEQVGRNGSLWQTLANNIWNGQLYSNFWQVEAGRIFQTPALFLFGMWLGRKSYFEKSVASNIFWGRTLIVAVAACVPLYMLKELVPPHIESITIQAYYGIAIPMLYNFAFMAVLVAAFVLLWFNKGEGYRAQRFTIAYGKMSLTNYIGQSIVGVTVYYHFGLNLWCHTGPLESVCIAIGIFIVQLIFSRYWLKSHKQGPLEYIWKKLTWLNFRPYSNKKISII